MSLEFQQLLSVYLDETLAPAERQALEELLRVQPDLRSLFRQHLALEGLLHAKHTPLPGSGALLKKIQACEVKRTTSSVLKTLRIKGLRRPLAPAGEKNRSRAIGWAAAALLLATLTGTAGYLGAYRKLPQPPPAPTSPQAMAEVLLAQPAPGEGLSLTRGGESLPLLAGGQLFEGDRIQTSREARLQLRLRQGGAGSAKTTLLTLGNEGQLRLERAAHGGVLLELDRGQLACAAAPQPAGRPLAVWTPHAVATVLGTQFSLTVSEQEARLEVKDGEVGFRGNAVDSERSAPQAISVKAGYYALARRHQPLDPPRPSAVALHGPPPPHSPPPPVSQPPRSRALVLHGFLAEEPWSSGAPRRSGSEGHGPRRFFLVDRWGNRFRLPHNHGRASAEGTRLQDFAGMLVTLRCRATYGESAEKRPGGPRTEIQQVEEIQPFTGRLSELLDSGAVEEAEQAQPDTREGRLPPRPKESLEPQPPARGVRRED